MNCIGLILTLLPYFCLVLKNKVMRLCGDTQTHATKVVLLLKLGENKV